MIFFPFFIQVNYINKLCLNFNFGKNLMTFDPYLLKLGFYGPQTRVLWPKKFFHIFLLQVHCNNKLCLDFNFGKNFMKIDHYRLKLGFYGPQTRVLWPK